MVTFLRNDVNINVHGHIEEVTIQLDMYKKVWWISLSGLYHDYIVNMTNFDNGIICQSNIQIRNDNVVSKQLKIDRHSGKIQEIRKK